MEAQQKPTGKSAAKGRNTRRKNTGKAKSKAAQVKKKQEPKVEQPKEEPKVEQPKEESKVEESKTKATENQTDKAVAKKKKTRYFETYISKVLKNVAADNGITANAKQQLNSAICVVAKTISATVTHLTFVSKKKTMSTKEVENAIRLLLSGSLAENALKQANESVEKFAGEDAKHSSRQDKAGILFPPSIAEKFLRNFGFSKVMVTKTAPVFFAAVLEHLTADILVLASKLAREHNRVRITIRDLELTVRTDSELNDLWQKCRLSFIGGGVVPQIHESLLTKKPRRKRKNKPNTEKGTEKGTKKGHRFRPGTVSLREIKKYQKTSNCLTFAKFPFERFVRGIVGKYQSGMKISKDVFTVLQYYIEQFVVDFLRDANAAAIHSGRVKLMPPDIQFIARLRQYDELDTTPFKKEETSEESTEQATEEPVAEELEEESAEELEEQ